MTEISFMVPCVPVPQPRQQQAIRKSKSGGLFVQNFLSERHPVQAYKATIRQLAAQHYDGPPLDGPLSIGLIFILPRPGRLIWAKRPMPRVWQPSGPDFDNLAKSSVDALAGLLFRNDSQFCQAVVQKFIAAGDEQPHVAISIKTLEEPEQPEPVSNGGPTLWDAQPSAK